MAEPIYTEQIKLLAPSGFREAVSAAARTEGRTASEFIREAIRDRLRRGQPAEAGAQ